MSVTWDIVEDSRSFDVTLGSSSSATLTYASSEPFLDDVGCAKTYSLIDSTNDLEVYPQNASIF